MRDLNNDLKMFNRVARAIATAIADSEDHRSGIDLKEYRGIRAAACEIYQQLSAFHASPKRSDFLKACGVWEPKDGDR